MSGYAEKERMIREKRTIEATRKNMMGATGKLGLITKWLGTKIVRQGSGLFDQTFLDDPFVEEEYMPTLNEAAISNEGYHFDGLSRGMHFEVKYMHGNSELTAYYKGYLVYKEIAGDLYAYAPFPEWENLVEPLYLEAEKRANKEKVELDEEKEKSFLRLGQMFIHKLRMEWGL